MRSASRNTPSPPVHWPRACWSAAHVQPARHAAPVTSCLCHPPSGPTIQHVDLRGAAEPAGADREALLASFKDTVSLIENAEKLQEWDAAPEQRLALWMRHLPAVRGEGPRRHLAGTRLHESALQWSTTDCRHSMQVYEMGMPGEVQCSAHAAAHAAARQASCQVVQQPSKRYAGLSNGSDTPTRTPRRARTTRPRRSGL